MELEIMGISTNYIYTEGTGETVLFLHGWGAHIGLYSGIFGSLQQKGYRVAAFDMPGVGKTAEPKAPFTLADYVAFTLEFCQKCGITRAILMCHSHGGRIALAMLCDERCPVACEKAVLIDSAGIAAQKTQWQRLKLFGYKALKRLGTSKLGAPLFSDLYERARDSRSSADYRAASPVMRATMSNVLPADFSELMPKIRAQVLLIWGELDTATPLAMGKKMEELIANAGLAVIKGAGHFSFIDNPAQFYAVLDAFL